MSIYHTNLDVANVPDLWSRLVGSPVLRPSTPSIASSLAIDRMDVIMETDAIDEGHDPPLLDSLVHLHELPGTEFAYAYLERDVDSAPVTTPAGVCVFNGRPIRPRVVCADRIVWRPVLGRDGVAGHRYDLIHDGELQAHVEVFVSATAVHRVALVHRLFTPTAIASGLVDRGSFLEFNSPSSHLGRLQKFLSAVPAGQFYAPVNECLLGRQFELPVEVDARHANNPSASVADLVWRHAGVELEKISELAGRASLAHNHSEFCRCGLS